MAGLRRQRADQGIPGFRKRIVAVLVRARKSTCHAHFQKSRGFCYTNLPIIRSQHGASTMNQRTVLTYLAAAIVAVAMGNQTASAQQDSGTAAEYPWSGYWWAHVGPTNTSACPHHYPSTTTYLTPKPPPGKESNTSTGRTCNPGSGIAMRGVRRPSPKGNLASPARSKGSSLAWAT